MPTQFALRHRSSAIFLTSILQAPSNSRLVFGKGTFALVLMVRTDLLIAFAKVRRMQVPTCCLNMASRSLPNKTLILVIGFRW